MATSWESLQRLVDSFAPNGSPRRQLIQILAIVLLFEGVSVVILFSYAAVALGIISLAIGALLLLIFPPRMIPAEQEEREEVEQPSEAETPGIRFVERIIVMIGGDYVLLAVGIMIVAAVLAYNAFVSVTPALGDTDTLTLLFSAVMIMFPFARRKYKIEAVFSLLFIGLVMVFLVLPQLVTVFSGSVGSSKVGNFYVHYMLAAPFARILDLLGIPSTSSGSFVTIEFRDGTIHTLGISAYCAGLYSFSIFLAAFFSFVLVFERLPRRMLAIVLAIGLLVAYAGNLFRMVIIGLVGYYRGIDALLWAHENVGWIVFLSWSAVFWYLLLNFISKKQKPRKTANGGD